MESDVRVCLEEGRSRVFASALDWPGWSRSGRGEQAAVEALLAYADRYRAVAERAGAAFPARPAVSVVDRVPGNATTDFGAPAVASRLDADALTGAARRRQVDLLRAAWTLLDDVVASAPQSLRRGPRGGGRDRDEVLAHVLEAERSYARKLGVRHPPYRAEGAIGAMRAELVDVLLAGRGDGDWHPRYALRRIAWHVLDHAWEIEDRSE